MTQLFNIHDLLQVTLDAPDGEFRDYVNLEFGHWSQGKGEARPDLPAIAISLEEKLYREGTVWALGKGLFLNEDTDEIYVSRDRGTSFFDPGRLYAAMDNIFTEKDGSGESGRMKVRLHPGVLEEKKGLVAGLRRLKRRWLHPDPRSTERKIAEKFISQYVEPNIFRLLLGQDRLLLHAAALEKNGRGILILGPQNVGKTTVTLGLTRSGWNMLGDDLCLLDREGRIQAYPKPLKLERELLEQSERARQAAREERLRQDPALQGRASLSGKAGSYEIKVPPSALGVEIGDTCRLDTAFFLRRVFRPGQEEGIMTDQLGREEAITLCEQHVAAEYDVNKHLDRDIRQNLALHYHRPVGSSVVTPQVSDIIRDAFGGVHSRLLTIGDPSADLGRQIEKSLPADPG